MKISKDVKRKLLHKAEEVGENYLIKNHNRWDFYDRNLRRITNMKFINVQIIGNLVKVTRKYKDELFVGLYNDKGKKVISIRWKEIELLKKCICCVGKENMKSIYTYDFKVALPLKDWKGYIIGEEGIVATNQRDRLSLYNWEGQLIVDRKKNIKFLNDELIRTENFSDKYALYNIKGEEVLSAQYSTMELIYDIYGNQYVKVQSGGNSGLYDINIQPIIPCEKEYIDYSELIFGRPFKVEKNNESLLFSLSTGKLKLVS